MPRSIHLTDPHHFTAGAVGPPGQRTFFLQAADEGALVSFKLEKQQVAALAEYLETIMADLPALAPPAAAAPALIEPVVAEWTVGGIGIAVDEGSDRILLVIHELVDDAGEVPGDDPEGDDLDDEVAELLAALVGDDEDQLEEEFDEEFDDGEASMARIRLTREQVAGFIARASELMQAGRPPCPFCGLPLDPSGHICPRAN